MLNYTVKAGDNLTKIAAANGVSLSELIAANPSIKNPNLIRTGQSVVVPVKESAAVPAAAPAAPAGSLEKTLPPLDAPTLPSGPNTLPPGAPQLDQLSALRLALKNASQIAFAQGTGDTMNAAFGSLEKQGIKPSGISGSSFGGIVDFVQRNVAAPIETQTNTILESVNLAEKKRIQDRDDARSNLVLVNNMIKDSGKTWDEIDPKLKEQIAAAEKVAGIPEGTFEAFAKTKPKANLLATTQGTDAAGNDIISFVYADEFGNPGVVKTIKTGGKSKAPGSSGGGGSISGTTKAAMIAKARGAFDAEPRGDDGKVNPNFYTRLRQDYASITGSTTAFDDAFATELSPQERANLGVGKAAGVSAGSGDDDIY